MNTITECLQQRHQVTVEVVQSWYMTCRVTLGQDEDDQPVAVVATTEPLDADLGPADVGRWKCQTCQARADTIQLQAECR